MASKATLPNGLPPVQRFITTHNADGQAIFSSTQHEDLEWQKIGSLANFSLGYATNKFPVDLQDDADMQTYEHYLQNKPGITIPGGTVLRLVDTPPGSLSPMHRTVSLDYGVVLEGEVELILDSGEKRVLRRGDIAIQRGTNHAWRNTSTTQWARMLYVLQESEEFKVAGKTLGEDYGEGVGVIPMTR